MKNNLIMTAIYAFSAFCLFVAWSRYHNDWSTFREVLHFLVMVSFYLAAVVSALIAGQARKRARKKGASPMKIESIVVYLDKPKVTEVKEPLATTVHLGKMIGEVVAQFEASDDGYKIITIMLNKVQPQ